MLFRSRALAAKSPRANRTVKTLVDRGVGRAVFRVLRFAPGAQILQAGAGLLYAALVVEGGVTVEGQRMGKWDFIRIAEASRAPTLSFSQETTLLAVTLR